MQAREPTTPDQESVWDYPRPAILEPTGRRLTVIFAGRTVADTVSGHRVLETSHPPTYYFPPGDVAMDLLRRVADTSGSFCEWKGAAVYFDIVVDGRTAARAAWSYPRPQDGFEAISGHIAFYAGRVDEALVDGERVTPQPGGFYGGWITRHVAGPFKGGPGTMGW